MIKTLLPLWILVLADVCLPGQTVTGATVKSTFIYPRENRPTPQCHASTIVQTTDGSLLAAWFGGSREGEPDVGIWVARLEKGKWTEPMMAADGAWTLGRRFPCWNPVLFQPPQGPVWLFFKVGPDVDTWWGERLVSHDQGQTWQQRQTLPQGGIGPVKNKPIILADGAWLCPSSSEHQRWRVHFEISRDEGKTWQTVGPINSGENDGAIQPTILVHRDGRLQALCRAQKAGVILQSWSQDQGQTWSALQPTLLPNPNSGIDACTLQDGRFVLIYNPQSKGRNRLNAAISSDGIQWMDKVILENKPSGEFSYPAVIQSKDGLVHVTYTYLRETIKHVTLDPERM